MCMFRIPKFTASSALARRQYSFTGMARQRANQEVVPQDMDLEQLDPGNLLPRDGGTGGGGGGGGGGSLTPVYYGRQICTLNGIPFYCPYIDYRTPNGGTTRNCYWEEGGVIKHSITCG